MSQPRIYRRYVDASGRQVHLRIGEPETVRQRPLICFHLSPVSGVIYDKWIPEISKDRICVAPDTPGYGMSDPPDSQPQIADFSRTMGEVADALGIDEFDCMGYHTGSKIALELALQRPDKVRHLVLVSTPIYTDEELASQYAAMGELHEPRDDGSHLLEMWQSNWQWRGPEQTAADLMEPFAEMLRGGEHKPWGHRAAFAYTYPDKLKDVDQAILVINTADDLQEYTSRVKPLLKNGRVLDLPDWGHGFLDYHTAETGEFVREFLDS
jgi:pimeloyl-ACP methyl ester carboxylesterase